MADRLAYIARELPAAIARLVPDLGVPVGGRVVDYGCADGPYRRLLGPGVEYIGADLPGNPTAAVEVTADGRLPLDDESVDAVLSTQVLEHVDDPRLYLEECRRVLRPGGRLLVSTHGIMVYHPDPDDYWRWTSAGLRKALAAAGLAVVRFEGVMGLGATGIQLFQDSLYHRLPRSLAAALALVAQALIGVVDRLEPRSSRDLNALVFAAIAERR